MSVFQRLFGGGKPSSRKLAKDRLQLVLVQDRVKLTPDQMDHLKDDLIQAISKYVEIDTDGIEISLNQSGRHSLLTADIPVVGSRDK